MDDNSIKHIVSNSLISTSSVNPPLNILPNDNTCIKATFDSGASGHYLRPADIKVAQDIQAALGPTVTLPNLQTVTATKKAKLPLSPSLSSEAQTAHILPSLQTATLLSVGQLCDNNCDVIFRKEKVHVLPASDDIEKIISKTPSILQGDRNYRNNLWDTCLYPRKKRTITSDNFKYPLPHPSIYPQRSKLFQNKRENNINIIQQHSSTPIFFADMEELISTNECNSLVDNQLRQDRKKDIPKSFHNPFQSLNLLIDENVKLQPQLNIIIRKDETKRDLAKFLHGSCGWPVRSTFVQTIRKNYFITWPGLEPKLIDTHLPDSVPTAKGHLRQEYQGLQSTSNKKRLDRLRQQLQDYKNKKHPFLFQR